MPIRSICARYHQKPLTSYQRDNLLKQAFQCYNYYVKQLAYKYSSIVPSFEPEDWESIIQVGIWEGLERCSDPLKIRHSIYYRIRFQISKQLQILSAKKQSWSYEVMCDDFSSRLNQYLQVQEEDKWITRIDVETALENLDERDRKMLIMWMEGYKVVEDICPEVGLKDAAVYNHIAAAVISLKSSLEGYEM